MRAMGSSAPGSARRAIARRGRSLRRSGGSGRSARRRPGAGPRPGVEGHAGPLFEEPGAHGGDAQVRAGADAPLARGRRMSASPRAAAAASPRASGQRGRCRGRRRCGRRARPGRAAAEARRRGRPMPPRPGSGYGRWRRRPGGPVDGACRGVSRGRSAPGRRDVGGPHRAEWRRRGDQEALAGARGHVSEALDEPGGGEHAGDEGHLVGRGGGVEGGMAHGSRTRMAMSVGSNALQGLRSWGHATRHTTRSTSASSSIVDPGPCSGS